MRSLVLGPLAGQYDLIIVQFLPTQPCNLIGPLPGKHEQLDDRAVVVVKTFGPNCFQFWRSCRLHLTLRAARLMPRLAPFYWKNAGALCYARLSGTTTASRSSTIAIMHHGEVMMCIAGGMAHAKHLDDGTDWRKHASSADVSIARRHRGKLGDAAKSWGQYEEDTAALVNKYWAMIEAVAARLMKVDVMDANDIDSICRRVVRQQHLGGGNRRVVRRQLLKRR
jgi:hypothetical protein